MRLVLRGGRVYAPQFPCNCGVVAGAEAQTPAKTSQLQDCGHASAICVDEDRVVWVGDDEHAGQYADGADRVVELAGRLVTPGFVDAHAHLAQTGFALGGLDLTTARSLGEALDALAARARATTVPVVLGHGWDETTWPERRAPSRAEIDQAAGGRAVYLSRVDAHSAVVSTALLERRSQIAESEGYDPSGRLERDAHHLARDALFEIVPSSARTEVIERALRSAARSGIAMVHELGGLHLCLPSDLATAREVSTRAGLPEVIGYWGQLGAVDEARSMGCAGLAGDLCVDGSVGSRTAALHAPYADANATGHLYLDVEQVADHVVACTRAGLQAGFHVIGDRAVATAVQGLSAAADVVGKAALVAARHRLEHVEMATPEQIATLAALGVVASMQPMFDAKWGDSMYVERLGRARAQRMNAFASMRAAGVALAFGSDSPVTSFGPWAAVRAAAAHHNEAERISVTEAFDAHTVGGWRAARRDGGGVLEVGAPASLAVWDLPRGADASSSGLPVLLDEDLPGCVLTLVRGRVAHEEEGAL